MKAYSKALEAAVTALVKKQIAGFFWAFGESMKKAVVNPVFAKRAYAKRKTVTAKTYTTKKARDGFSKEPIAA